MKRCRFSSKAKPQAPASPEKESPPSSLFVPKSLTSTLLVTLAWMSLWYHLPVSTATIKIMSDVAHLPIFWWMAGTWNMLIVLSVWFWPTLLQARKELRFLGSIAVAIAGLAYFSMAISDFAQPGILTAIFIKRLILPLAYQEGRLTSPSPAQQKSIWWFVATGDAIISVVMSYY